MKTIMHLGTKYVCQTYISVRRFQNGSNSRTFERLLTPGFGKFKDQRTKKFISNHKKVTKKTKHVVIPL